MHYLFNAIARKIMINTYNESSLHRELKEKYAALCRGQTEVEYGGFICDVINDEVIYEIQTSNISKLRPKIEKLTQTRKIWIIFPVAEITEIVIIDKNGKTISKRKSPKKENIFCIYRQITGILDLFGLENFGIKVLFINQQRIRQKTKEAVQLANKSRRHKREWIPLDKKLAAINNEIEITSKNDLINLVKNEIAQKEEFCLKDLKQTAIKENASLVIWCLKKLNAIKQTKVAGKSKYYSFIL